MTYKFKIGDKVHVKSEYCSSRNFTQNGTIEDITVYGDITIQWDDGIPYSVSNYRPDWLELITDGLKELQKVYANKN